jgi:hypothetical protein
MERIGQCHCFTPTALAICGYSLSGCAMATPFTEPWTLKTSTDRQKNGHLKLHADGI